MWAELRTHDRFDMTQISVIWRWAKERSNIRLDHVVSRFHTFSAVLVTSIKYLKNNKQRLLWFVYKRHFLYIESVNTSSRVELESLKSLSNSTHLLFFDTGFETHPNCLWKKWGRIRRRPHWEGVWRHFHSQRTRYITRKNRIRK